MKKSLVLAMPMALGVTASAYAANPFSDVPAGHWAYDSIDKLAAAGVIDGMGDGTFQGDRNMTRYEMAQIVAKAMAKGANVDKLAAEFADELDALGVRVAKLEKKADNVKVSGRLLARAWSFHGREDRSDPGEKLFDNNHRYVLRSEIFVNGQINEDWSYTARLRNEHELEGAFAGKGEETVMFKEAYVTGKLGGLKVLAGRYNDYLEDGDIFDDFADVVKVEYGKKVKLTAGYGQYDWAVEIDDVCPDAKFGYARLDGEFGKIGAHVGYYQFNNCFDENEDAKTLAAGLNIPLGKDFKLAGTYFHSFNNLDGAFDKNGYTVNLDYKGASNDKPGSYGLWAKYYNLPAGVVVAHTMDGLYPYDGFKGVKVGGDYTIAKNIMGRVEWYDLKGKELGGHYGTIYSHVMFSF